MVTHPHAPTCTCVQRCSSVCDRHRLPGCCHPLHGGMAAKSVLSPGAILRNPRKILPMKTSWLQRTARWAHAPLLAALCFLPLSPATAQTSNTLVRIQTLAGPLDLELYDTDAPLTVANFLRYVRSGGYEGSFFHRLVSGFVIQGGGLRWDDAMVPPLGAVAVSATVPNEFSASRSNLRGTLAMAKVAGNPDSATSQWFINLADNAANLDGQNGGFTVFGRVLAPSMAVADALARLRLVNASGCANLGAAASAMSQVPMQSPPADCEGIGRAHLVMMSDVRELPRRFTLASAERVMDYLEAQYPQFVGPANAVTQQSGAWSFRSYPQTQSHVGVMGDSVYALVPSIATDLIPLGPLADWLEQARSVGY
jgi:peptidyl-prolyl cis-trans isomerase A (cyclophilin A)